MKVTPKLWIALEAVAKVAYRIGLSPRCGISYTLLRGLERVQVEPVKTVLQVGLSPNFCVCAGGNSENGAGNMFPSLYKECSQILESLNHAWAAFFSYGPNFIPIKGRGP